MVRPKPIAVHAKPPLATPLSVPPHTGDEPSPKPLRACPIGPQSRPSQRPLFNGVDGRLRSNLFGGSRRPPRSEVSGRTQTRGWPQSCDAPSSLLVQSPFDIVEGLSGPPVLDGYSSRTPAHGPAAWCLPAGTGLTSCDPNITRVLGGNYRS